MNEVISVARSSEMVVYIYYGVSQGLCVVVPFCTVAERQSFQVLAVVNGPAMISRSCKLAPSDGFRTRGDTHRG